jgi:hypothetical protein
LFADLRADAVDLEAHVHAVDHALLVRVLGHQVALEEAQGVCRGRGREADEVGVEVLQHLPPQAVDAAVALVGDDDIEVLDGDLGVVDDRTQLAVLAVRPGLVGRGFFGGFVQLFAAQHGVQALDGGDDDLGVGIDAAAVQVLHDVGLVEGVRGAGRVEVLVLLERLVAQVVAVHQEQDAACPGVLQQPPAEVAGGEGLAGAGGHLDERARAVGGERGFQAGDGVDLALAQAGGFQWWHLLQPSAQRAGLLQPGVQRGRLVEGEHAARAGRGVAGVAEVGFVAGALVVEHQRVGPARQVGRQAHQVAARLLGHAAERDAGLLGLDHAAGPAGDEQQVVAGAAGQLKLAHRHALGRVAVDVCRVLQHPAGGRQQRVDARAGLLLGTRGHGQPGRPLSRA